MATSLPSTNRWTCPWSPRIRVVVWSTISAPRSCSRTSGRSCVTVWPLRGAMMASLAGLLGRSATAVVAGAPETPPSPLEQAVMARVASATAATARRSLACWTFTVLMRRVPLLDALLEAAADGDAAVGGALHRERHLAGLEVDIGGEVPAAEGQQLQRPGRARRRHGGVHLVHRLLAPPAVKKVKWTVLAPGRPVST